MSARAKITLPWEHHAPEQPTQPLPARWSASLDRDGQHCMLTVEPYSDDDWIWSAALGAKNVTLVGSAADAESAKQEAQAVVELFLSGRPLFLDRRPTLCLDSRVLDSDPAAAQVPS